jgi:hypothetical protein
MEVAQQVAAHESARTNGLYDRRGDQVSMDAVEHWNLSPPRGIIECWAQKADP